MKILLLGSNGQLGSDILRVKTLHVITAWNRSDADITDIDTLKAKLKKQDFDILINCTAYNNTEQAETNTPIAFAINAFSVKAMAEICKEKNARFVHISTDYVFGNRATPSPITESDAPAPLNIYGASKLMGESLAMNTHENTLIFRVASLFGVAGSSGKGGNFVETMLRLARENKPLRVISDQINSPTGTADMADIILKSLDLNIPSGIYHAVNSGQASWYDFAKKILALANIKATIEPVSAADYPSAIVRPSYSVLDNQKLARLVGPIPEWEKALERYLLAKKYLS